MKQRGSSRKKRLWAAWIALGIISVLSAVIYARYIKESSKTENILSPAASKIPEINESFNGTLKKEVTIGVGITNYPVYVRAALIFNWKQEGDDGVLYFKTPVEGEDYEIILNEEDWQYNAGDGYYYYKKPVASNGKTTELIKECTQLQTFHDNQRDEEYSLNLKIIAQTVQAVGHTDGKEYLMAVEDAWNASPPFENADEGDGEQDDDNPDDDANNGDGEE